MLNKLKNKDIFDIVNREIGTDSYFSTYYEGIPIEREVKHVEEIMNFAKPYGKILSIGCGYGIIEMLMKDMSNEIEEIVGLDITPKKIDYMEKIIDKFDIDHIKCIQGDASELPYPDESFDYAFIIESLSHIDHSDKVDKALEEAVRVLKDNGNISVIDLNNGMNPRMIYRAWKFEHFKEKYEKVVNPYFTRTKLRSLGVTDIEIKPYNFPGELKGFRKDFWDVLNRYDRLGMFFSCGFMLKGRKVA